MTAAGVTVALLLLWSLALLAPGVLELPVAPAARYGVITGTLWFLCNFYTWMVPSWRRHVVERRGPLLGFGFAFAAALVSAVVDAFQLGAASGVALFTWRFIILSIPFALPHVLTLSPYPHLVDLGVLGLGLLLPHLPGFTGLWLALPASPHPGFFSAATTAGTAGVLATATGSLPADVAFGGRAHAVAGLGPGHLTAMALIATYFYGARFWTAAPLDWMRRRGDIKAAIQVAAYGLAGAGIGGWMADLIISETVTPWPVLLPVGDGAFAWLLVAVGLASVFEELLFRGLLLSGLRHWVPSRIVKGIGKPFPWVAAGGVAFLHAWIGLFGAPFWAAFGLSLGIGLAYTTVNRLLPAVLGHAVALLLMALAQASI